MGDDVKVFETLEQAENDQKRQSGDWADLWEWHQRALITLRALFAERDIPVDMILHCPACGFQHVDAPEPEIGWTNPPHKTHQCKRCTHLWRPSMRRTNGVASISHEEEQTGDLGIATLRARAAELEIDKVKSDRMVNHNGYCAVVIADQLQAEIARLRFALEGYRSLKAAFPTLQQHNGQQVGWDWLRDHGYIETQPDAAKETDDAR